MTDASPHISPIQGCDVLPATGFVVVSGMARGEAMAGPEDVCPDDVYRLLPGVQPCALRFLQTADGLVVAPGSETGSPGEAIAILARYRLMDDDGAQAEVLLVAVGEAALHVLPLTPLPAGKDHTLVAVEPPPPEASLFSLMCVSFLRGTRVTMADGHLRPVETLRPGDMVLTRDHGRQPLRWVGRATLRATGPFAPVVITRGRLGNTADLILGQQHRLFLFHRQPQPGLGSSEILVQARDLVDGDTIYLREGGFADYFGLVFERHEIVYAEGVPCESLMVNAAMLLRLPPSLASDLATSLPGVSQRPRPGVQPDRDMIASIGPSLLPPPRRTR